MMLWAIKAINTYISLAPNEANPYDTRGDLYSRNGRLSDAIDSYLKALEKKPDFHASRANLGHMYLFSGDNELARQAYQSLIDYDETGSGGTGRFHLTYLPVIRGKLTEGLDAIDSAQSKNVQTIQSGETKAWPSFHYMKGLILHEQGKTSQAFDEMKRSLDIYQRGMPDDYSRYTYMLAYYLAEMGDQNGADSLTQLIWDYYQSKSREPKSHYKAKGLVALARQDYSRAVAQFELNVRGSTPATDFAAFYYYAQACLKAGLTERAIEIYESLLPVYTASRILETIKHVKTNYYLGQAYEQAGLDDKAREQYEIFLTTWKDADPGLRSVEDAKNRLVHLKSRS